MTTFREFLVHSKGDLTHRYDARAFASLPWDWDAMIRNRVLQPLFYYAKENYVDGQPERMWDGGASIITIPNLREIPKDELSATNIHTGMPDLDVAEMCADWMAMSKELGGTPKDWADKNVNVRWKFTEAQKKLIYEIIGECWE